MSLFSSNKKSDKVVAIIHISSGQVSGSVVRLSGTAPTITPTLIVTHEAPIEIVKDANFEQLLGRMQKALAQVSRELAHSGAPAPVEIHCFLGAPWRTSVSRTIMFEKKTPFAFTKRIADDLIEKETVKATADVLATYPFHEEKLHLIERTVLSVALNGYAHADPYGKKTMSAELSLFMSFAPESFIDSLKREIAKGYGNERIDFHSFVVAGAVVSRALLPEATDFIFVDTGRELTDMAVVKNGSIEATVSFPFGTNFVIRRIMTDARTDYAGAERLFSMHDDNMLDDTTAKPVEKILSGARADWQRAFSNALLATGPAFSMPQTIILTGDTRFASWFKEALIAADFHFVQVSQKKCTVLMLDRSAMMPYVKNEAGAELHHFSMIESVFICHEGSFGLK